MYRTERLNSEMRKVLSDVLSSRMKDPRIGNMVSVTSVSVAKDLKTAKVYVSVYGGKEKEQAALAALTSAAGFIRKELASEFSELRTVPALDFRIDSSLEYGAKIESILEEINHSDADRSN